jgi:hypothetical protein
MRKYGEYAKYKKDEERRLVVHRLLIIAIILIVLSAMILCGYFFAMSDLHYWYADVDGFGLMFSVGKHLIRLGQTP